MIPLAVPNLTGKEQEYVSEAISSGWVGPEGPFVERFEHMVARASGRKWAVATITGTTALHAAAYVLFRDRTDQFSVNRFAFPALKNVLHNLGLKVVQEWGDVSHDCWMTSERWPSLADCAPAMGNPPTDATVDCYSFAANKTVTCGHGGAVCGDDWGLRTSIREAIAQGYDRSGVFNYRMANINAAIGCAQMERLDEFRERKKAIWNRYKEAGLPMIDRGPSRWMSTMEETEFLDFRDIMARFSEADIGHRCDPNGNISLPCSTSLTTEDQDRVIGVLA